MAWLQPKPLAKAEQEGSPCPRALASGNGRLEFKYEESRRNVFQPGLFRFVEPSRPFGRTLPARLAVAAATTAAAAVAASPAAIAATTAATAAAASAAVFARPGLVDRQRPTEIGRASVREIG